MFSKRTVITMLKKRIGQVIFSFFVFALLLSGCRKPTAVVKHEGPEQVVREAIDTLVQADATRYAELLDIPESSLDAAWKIQAFQKQTKRMVRKFARQTRRRGGLKSVDLAEEGIKYTHMVSHEDGSVTFEPTTFANSVDGDTAEVTVTITYGNGSADAAKDFQLIKKKGSWLLKIE